MSLFNRGFQKAIRTFRAGSYALGTEQLFLPGSKKSSLALMYHGVDKVSKTDFNVRFISAGDLREQVRYFKKRFTIVPVKALFEEKNTGRTRIALTFDDGLRNNFTYALPVLEEEKVPAGFYVTSIRDKGHDRLWPDAVDIYDAFLQRLEWNNFVFEKKGKRLVELKSGQPINRFAGHLSFAEKMELIDAMKVQAGFVLEEKPELADYWQLMTGEEIRQTANSAYVTIGSHACYHNRLDLVSETDAKEELLHSKSWLEKVTGKAVDELAWPNGSYTRRLVELAANAGYRYQLACDYLYEADRDDPRLLDRFGLYSDRSSTEQLHQVNRALRP